MAFENADIERPAGRIDQDLCGRYRSAAVVGMLAQASG
jgi:hypothetical protein